jgi:hypothetical protein
LEPQSIPLDSHSKFGDSVWISLNSSGETSTGRLPGTITQFIFADRRPGDFDGNGVLEAVDINDLTGQSASGLNKGSYDLNNDTLVNGGDVHVWVKDLFNSWIGDANLDGEFNSGDLVAVLSAGEYEDGLIGNSSWTSGAWDGDGEFTTSDLITALADGGYEQGPRQAVAVPEPTSYLLLALGTLVLRFNRRAIL